LLYHLHSLLVHLLQLLGNVLPAHTPVYQAVLQAFGFDLRWEPLIERF